MSIQLNAYLAFRDNARQAMEFYHSVFGGTLRQNTFAEFHASPDSAEDHKIMHSMLEGDNGITLMAADTPNSMEIRPGAAISLSLSGDNDKVLSGYFQKLSVGGTVREPLAVAPWGDKFGMVTDKFGFEWMVNITLPKEK